MDLDLDKFKAKRPWVQPAFWITLVPMVMVLLPTDARDFLHRHWEAVAAASGPFMVWMLQQGLVRYGGVRAAGDAAAAIGPEAARQASIWGQDVFHEDTASALPDTRTDGNPPAEHDVDPADAEPDPYERYNEAGA